MFLPSYIELVTAYPTCWITRTLHERPPIWFAVTHDCCFSLGAPRGRVIADKVLYYFEDTYIGRVRRNAPQCSPLFPIKELPRTKNNIEAWHNSFQANVSSALPTFWKFLDIPLREERIVQVRMLQNQAGHAPEPQRRRYDDCNGACTCFKNARILRFVNNYPNCKIMEYLRNIAHKLFL